MKKNFFIILTILLIIAIIVGYTVHNYRKQQIQIAQYNKQYESWYGKKMLGTDFISIINKTIDNNEKNDVQKDENNVYLEDNEKSVKIYIKFLLNIKNFVYRYKSNRMIIFITYVLNIIIIFFTTTTYCRYTQ